MSGVLILPSRRPTPAPFIYGRGLTVDEFKEELRRHHHRDNRARRFRRGIDGYAAAAEIAREFWARYERVNREFLPDDPVYSAARAGVATGTTSDLLTFLAVASRKWRVLEFILGSEGTASGAERAVWNGPSASQTGAATNLTPEKFDANSPTSLFSTTNIATTFATTQPTLAGNNKIVWGWNAFGGFIDWKAMPGEESNHLNEQMSLRKTVSTSALSITAIWEEL